MFNRQKLFWLTHTTSAIVTPVDCESEIWDGGFSEHVCNAIRDTNTHTHTHCWYKRNEALSIASCTHLVHVVCFAHSVALTFCCFSWAAPFFHLLSGTKELVGERECGKKANISSALQKSTTDPKKRETIKYEEVTLSPWTKSWHKQVGVGVFVNQPIFSLLGRAGLRTVQSISIRLALVNTSKRYKCRKNVWRCKASEN